MFDDTGIEIQCNLDLVTILVSAKTVTKSHVTKSNDFMQRLITKICDWAKMFKQALDQKVYE